MDYPTFSLFCLFDQVARVVSCILTLEMKERRKFWRGLRQQSCISKSSLESPTLVIVFLTYNKGYSFVNLVYVGDLNLDVPFLLLSVYKGTWRT
jgi:hypothetical protein